MVAQYSCLFESQLHHFVHPGVHLWPRLCNIKIKLKFEYIISVGRIICSARISESCPGVRSPFCIGDPAAARAESGDTTQCRPP